MSVSRLLTLFVLHMNSFSIILELLAWRVIFAAIVLSLLVIPMTAARKKLTPLTRSRIWKLFIPALFLPFEHSAVFLAQKLNFFGLPEVFNMIYLVVSYIWAAGFLYFLIMNGIQKRKTVRSIKAGSLTSCAAYFYRGRSRIYLPPDFDTDYTSAQKEMLLAHERQHIRQHDPVLYRIIQTISCIFWFSPLIHKAVGYIRQDRELLCDERVLGGSSDKNFTSRDYGLLLIREAQKSSPGLTAAGIVSEPGRMYERIKACAVPFEHSVKPALITVCAVIFLTAAGLVGAANPILEKPMDVRMFIDRDFTHIDGAEDFVSLTGKAAGLEIEIDESGLFDFMLGKGFGRDQVLDVMVTSSVRPSLFGMFSTSTGVHFELGELLTDDISAPLGNGSFDPFTALFENL